MSGTGATSMPSQAGRGSRDRRHRGEAASTQHRSVVRGTGNSAAKLNRTNVWGCIRRSISAATTRSPSTTTAWDVGVSPAAAARRRVRLGLSRNVRDLYEFVPALPAGDHIYIFGFSRGTFTARTLAGLIASAAFSTRPRRCRACAPSRRDTRTIGLNTRWAESRRPACLSKLPAELQRRAVRQTLPAACATCSRERSRCRRTSDGACPGAAPG